MSDSMILLVDNAAGIYAYHSLVTRYPLYVSDGPTTKGAYVPLEEWLENRVDMQGETAETIFHPDNLEWCENVEYCAYHNILAVKGGTGEFWCVESIEGDLWAINPAAVWDDETETYVMGGGGKCLNSPAKV